MPPRSWRTVYQVSSIDRSEPARSLFDVPSDYTRHEVPAPGLIFKKMQLEQ
jgi:hypothetical protein